MGEILPPPELERIAKLAARTYAGPNKPLKQMLATGWPTEEMAWAAVVSVVAAEVQTLARGALARLPHQTQEEREM